MMVRPVEHFVALVAQIVGTGTSISASAMYFIGIPIQRVFLGQEVWRSHVTPNVAPKNITDCV